MCMCASVRVLQCIATALQQYKREWFVSGVIKLLDEVATRDYNGVCAHVRLCLFMRVLSVHV